MEKKIVQVLVAAVVLPVAIDIIIIIIIIFTIMIITNVAIAFTIYVNEEFLLIANCSATRSILYKPSVTYEFSSQNKKRSLGFRDLCRHFVLSDHTGTDSHVGGQSLELSFIYGAWRPHVSS
jgi:hypothetical protein